MKKIRRPRYSLLERVSIESGLNSGEYVYQIAEALGRDRGSLAKEINKHALWDRSMRPGKYNNRCIHADTCELQNICSQCFDHHPKKCCNCCKCNANCGKFVEKICPKLMRSPYVCNGCDMIKTCVLAKRFYHADKAHEEYRKTLVESRQGVNLTEDEQYFLNTQLYKLVAEQGHSLNAAKANNYEELPYSLNALYNYVNKGVLTLKRGEMPRSCKLKKRKGKVQIVKVDKTCNINRGYDDYGVFIIDHPGINVTEMDTVEGVKGGKVLLTLHFLPWDFLVAILLMRKTSKCVINAFEEIFGKLKHYCSNHGLDAIKMFRKLFPVLLTDRGTEFTDPLKIENLQGIEGMTRIFYCDPRAAYQKPHIERNHENLRKILPKGDYYFKATSFDTFDQADISLALSHLNSYPRPSNGNETPYEAFARAFPTDLVHEVFGIVEIPRNDVILKPSLLGIKEEIKN